MKSRGAKRAPLKVVDFNAGTRGSDSAEWSTDDVFRLLVAGVRDYGIFLLDCDGRVETWNDGAERLKGYSARDIVGRHFSVFYPDVDIRAGKPEWELVVAAAEGRFEDEGLRVRKDGSTFWAHVVITAIHDDAGVLRGFGKVTQDVTARRQEEEHRLAQQRQEADRMRDHARRMAELESTKTEFLNLASHELRSPLVVARGYFSLLEDGSLSPDRFMEVVPLVSAKLAQMEVIVRQLLETARLDSDQLELELQTADLRTILEEQIAVIRPLFSPAHSLDVDVPKRPVLVSCDRVRLAAVVLNLLDNAVKYSPAGGLVQALVTVGGEHAFVSVRDHGLGVARADLNRLFTRFGRIDNPDARHIGGTGLGLYLSREIARRHGGDILVESKPGSGSRFTLSLPVQRRPPARR